MNSKKEQKLVKIKGSAKSRFAKTTAGAVNRPYRPAVPIPSQKHAGGEERRRPYVRPHRSYQLAAPVSSQKHQPKTIRVDDHSYDRVGRTERPYRNTRPRYVAFTIHGDEQWYGSPTVPIDRTRLGNPSSDDWKI